MKRMLILLALALCGVLAPAGAAQADFGLNGFDVTFTGPKGEILEGAGEHPFAMTIPFNVNSHETGEGGALADEAVRNVLFTFMPGFAASPTAVPTCSTVQFLTIHETLPSCPDSAAIGTAEVQLANAVAKPFAGAAVYNLETTPGIAAKIGFYVTGIPVVVDANLSSASPNLIVSGPTNISQLVEVLSAKTTLWGVPADPRHDSLRGRCIDVNGNSKGQCPVNNVVAEAPFITMPRACDGPLTSSYEALSWLGSKDSGSSITHDEAGNPKGMSGCGKIGFAPTATAQTTSRQAASPTGMDVSLHFEDEGISNPSGIAGSDLRKAVVTFPEGVTLNPSQAEGLATCSEAQVARETASSAFGKGCPAESKVGTVEAETPLLKGEVFRGSLFVATPYENPFGTLVALYMVVKEPERGISVTLAGKVEPDPLTGQIVTTFGDEEINPITQRPKSPILQQPISDVRVHLLEGTRSPLITPSHCGDYETDFLLTPSADPTHPRLATASFHIGQGVGGGPCPPAGTLPFEPGFEAGTLSNGAAKHSPFTMRLTRRDGDQDLTKFAATLPRGVLASLVGLEKCPDSAIAFARGRTGPHGGAEELADPSCKPAAKIGTTLAGAGVGSQLTYVPGSLYLAGPYNGAPLSVVSITPGVAGPFDVGTIVVRVALGFDPLSAQAKADGSRSDPIPHILRGIPLAVRDLRVSVDRPNWIFNPTSCRESATDATIFGSAADFFDPADDIGVARSARFQAADCLNLGFAPSLGLKLRGGTERGDFPALTATYVPKPGDANLRRLSLLFPRSAFIENAHFRTICTRKAFAAHSCPKGSVYGHATVSTPLLEETLSGPVYLRSSDNLLPDAVLDLHGIIDVEVPIKIDSHKQRLRATVAAAPDAPVSKAVVRMQGGDKGLFVNSRGLCAGKNRATLNLVAQSEKTLKRAPAVEAAGCRDGRRGRHRR